MGDAKQTYSEKLRLEKTEKKAAQREADSIRKQKVKTVQAEKKEVYSAQKLLLQTLKKDLTPYFRKIRRNPMTLFLLPYINPMHIHQLDKHSQPRLICYYGSLERIPHNGAEKTRTVITVHNESLKYTIEEQGWIGQSVGTLSPPVYAWRECGNGSLYGLSSERTIKYMNDRFFAAYKDHTKLKWKRLGYAFLIALALFTLYQCTS